MMRKGGKGVGFDEDDKRGEYILNDKLIM